VNEFTPDFFALAGLVLNPPNCIRSALDASQAQHDATCAAYNVCSRMFASHLHFSVNSSESNLGPTVMYL